MSCFILVNFAKKSQVESLKSIHLGTVSLDMYTAVMSQFSRWRQVVIGAGGKRNSFIGDKVFRGWNRERAKGGCDLSDPQIQMGQAGPEGGARGEGEMERERGEICRGVSENISGVPIPM